MSYNKHKCPKCGKIIEVKNWDTSTPIRCLGNGNESHEYVGLRALEVEE